MPGIGRTAVLAAAFLLVGLAVATAAPPQHVLPAGTAVVFVTDGPLDAGRREGDVVTVHLRDALVLDGSTLAPAGARAQLIVGATTNAEGKRIRPAISLDRFFISAGLMPVTAVAPIVPPVPAGAQIEAKTLAEVDHLGDRYSIRIPFPFRLSGDQPASAYTPTPARTAPARALYKPEPKPSATTVPTATPSPEPTKIPSR